MRAEFAAIIDGWKEPGLNDLGARLDRLTEWEEQNGGFEPDELLEYDKMLGELARRVRDADEAARPRSVIRAAADLLRILAVELPPGGPDYAFAARALDWAADDDTTNFAGVLAFDAGAAWATILERRKDLKESLN